MKKHRIGFIFVSFLMLCAAAILSACDKSQGDLTEVVAGKYDLSMYETEIDSTTDRTQFAIRNVKEEYRDKVTTAIIPQEVQFVRASAFEGCKNLKKIIVQGGLLMSEAVKNCENLQSIELYDGYTSIYERVFMNCPSLEEVVLPDSVRYIGEEAFKDCTKLKSIKMADSVLIDGGAFDNTALCDNIVDDMIYINDIAYKYVGDMPKNTAYKLREGTKNAAMYLFDNCDGLRHLILPDSMEYLPSAIASDCKNLLSLTIGKSFKKINYQTGAWWRVIPIIDGSPKIVEVYNRSDVEMTTDYFYTTENTLQMEILHVYNDTGHSALETRDNGQVYLVTDAEKVLVECVTDSDCIQVENGTTFLRSSFLIDCANVSIIEIPQSVTKIEMFDFGKENYQIQYAGTMAQWNDIDKSILVDYTVCCTDGTTVKEYT